MACASAKHHGQQDERAGMLHTANIARHTVAPHGRTTQPPTALRTASRAYQAALDDLTQRAGIAA
jgi:hypothetical protein